jgi:hypothetical protein
MKISPDSNILDIVKNNHCPYCQSTLYKVKYVNKKILVRCKQNPNHFEILSDSINLFVILVLCLNNFSFSYYYLENIGFNQFLFMNNFDINIMSPNQILDLFQKIKLLS